MKKNKKYHRKLVRDRIPEIIESKKQSFKVKTLSGSEFELALRKKFIEEAREIKNAAPDELVGELADMLELVHAASSHFRISLKKIECARDEKLKKRGGFKKKTFLVWSEE